MATKTAKAAGSDDDNRDTTEATDPGPCRHDYKKIVDKAGQVAPITLDNGARANVRCTKCGAEASQGNN